MPTHVESHKKYKLAISFICPRTETKPKLATDISWYQSSSPGVLFKNSPTHSCAQLPTKFESMNVSTCLIRSTNPLLNVSQSLMIATMKAQVLPNPYFPVHQRFPTFCKQVHRICPRDPPVQEIHPHTLGMISVNVTF